MQSFQTQTAAWTVTSGPAYVANTQGSPGRHASRDGDRQSAGAQEYDEGDIWGCRASPPSCFGPLSDRGSQISWTTQPSGTIGALKVFGSDGRLWQAALHDWHSGRTRMAELPQYDHAAAGSCTSSLLSVAFASTLRIGYVANWSAAGQVVQVNYGREAGQFTVQPGANHFYLAVHGSAATVALRSHHSPACASGQR